MENRIPKAVQLNYYHIPFEVATECQPHEAYVWSVVYYFSNGRDKKCYASNETIANALPKKSSVRSVQKALQVLESKGFISRSYVGEDKMQRLEITCHMPEIVRPTGQRVRPVGRGGYDPQVMGGYDPQVTRRLNTGFEEKKEKTTCNAIALQEKNDQQVFVVAIVDAFVRFNPACKKAYGNKTERNACQELVETHGLDRVLRVVDYIERSRGEPYAPVITTPHELWLKWSKLEAWGISQTKGNKKYSGSVGII